MKKVLFLALITLGCTQQIRTDYEPIYLNSTILSFVDGKFINAREIFRYAKNLLLLRTGGKSIKIAEELATAYKFALPHPLAEYNKRPGRIGLILYKNEYLTIEELAKLEADGGDPVEIEKSLDLALLYFDKLSEDYVSQIQVAKEYMVKLIDQWSQLRNSPETLLPNWSNLNCSERESMRNSLTSFKIFNTFLGELLLFLADLMHNCPKSLKKYRDSLKTRESAD